MKGPEQSVEQIQGFLQIDDHLGTAGQPFQDQFPVISDAGYRVVINLALPDSWDELPDEAQTVTGLGMEYIYIPVVWESPQPRDLDQFFTAMDRLSGEKVFVHCARNMRVSAFVYLYRVIRLGVPAETAQKDLFRIWNPNPTWQNFIDRSLESKPGNGPVSESLTG